MSNLYYCPKKFMDKKDVRFIYVFFDNGDYVTLNKSELVDFDFVFYDKLCCHESKFVPRAKSGFIKFNISRYKSSRYDSIFLNVNEDYNSKRKTYLENRLLDENGITFITFFDENNWSLSTLGHFKGRMESNYLILDVKDDYPSIEYKDVDFNIALNPLDKSTVRKMTLDFENCEMIDVYNEEIIELNLKFKNELEDSSCDYARVIESGFIRIKFNDNILYRHVNLMDDKKRYKAKDFIKRLCSKDKEANIDICRLYISYEYAGFGVSKTEAIEIENLSINIDEDDYDFESGNSKLLEDGSVLITFGKLI